MLGLFLQNSMLPTLQEAHCTFVNTLGETPHEQIRVRAGLYST